VQKGTVVIVLFLAFPTTAREKEKRAPAHSPTSSTTGHRQQALFFLGQAAKTMTSAVMQRWGGGGKRMRHPLLPPSRSGESRDKYYKKGTFSPLITITGRVKQFQNSFPCCNWPQVLPMTINSDFIFLPLWVHNPSQCRFF
jgi:hypothetical protein